MFCWVAVLFYLVQLSPAAAAQHWWVSRADQWCQLRHNRHFSPVHPHHNNIQTHSIIVLVHTMVLVFVSYQLSISSNVSEDIIEDEDRKWCMTQPHWPSCFVFYQLYSWSKYFQRGPSTGPQKASKLLQVKRYAVNNL